MSNKENKNLPQEEKVSSVRKYVEDYIKKYKEITGITAIVHTPWELYITGMVSKEEFEYIQNKLKS